VTATRHTNPDAAAYVAAHLPLLTKYSRSQRFRPWWVDPDDFQSDLVLQVLQAYATFRQVNDGKACPYCGGTGCSTWLGWRARKTGSRYHWQRQRDARVLDTWATTDDAQQVATVSDGPQVMHARAVVQQLLDRATPDQRDALVSKLEGWTGDDVWSRLGIGLGGRNYRLRRLLHALDNPDS